MHIRRPSPATVIAILALMLALSAPAWAGTVKKLITGKQIARNAITSPKVKNRSLLARDFKRGQLPRGARGPQGIQGPKGDTGAQGERGPAGPSLVGGAKSDSGTIGPIAGTMVDLASGATTTGQVVLPWTGLITANGFADVTTSAATASRTRCNLFISDGTGPNNGLAVFSPNSFGDTPATNNYHISIPLTGFITKPAGTYNIAVRCAVVSGSVVSHTAALSYTAVPAP